MHSLNTPKPLSIQLHVFSYGYWLETNLQMILLVLGIYFIVCLCEALQICSVTVFIFKRIILDVYMEIADIAIFNFL